MDYKGFIHGSYESQAYTADQEKTVNWYPERIESEGGTTKWALYPTPGVTQLSIGVSGNGRGHFAAANKEFAVIGDSLYEIGEFGNASLRGAVAIGANPATISYNGDGGGELFITSGGNGYILNIATSALTQVVALNGKATMGGYLDGYFLALDATTSTLYISALSDGLTWNTGTDFAQRSQAPDSWVSMAVNGKYIWLLGSETSEVWYDTGGSFPFAPHPSGLVSYGCAAPFSVKVVGSALGWLSTSVSGGAYVVQAAGFSPEVISDFPMQFAMSSYTQISDAVADSYNDLGHTFYILSFPTADVTWAWDAATGQWTNRGTWISEDGKYIAWRPRYHAMGYGEHRILDSANASVYRLSSTVSTDVDSRPIRRLRRAPALMAENTRVFYASFELDLEPALGLSDSTAQGYDPQVMLRFSNDGGKTWSQEMWRSAGKIGEYFKRVRWNRLGAGRRRVFEVSTSDPMAWKLTGAYLALSQPPQQQGMAQVSG